MRLPNIGIERAWLLLCARLQLRLGVTGIGGSEVLVPKDWPRRSSRALDGSGEDSNMTKRLLSAMVLFASIFAAPPCLWPQGEIDALHEMERRLADAWVQGDKATIDGLLSDDWAVIDISGQRRTKEQVFRDMFGPDGPQIASMQVDELDVRILGNVAVVTGRTVATAESGLIVTLRFTDVAVQRGGRWRFVSSQGTRVEQ